MRKKSKKICGLFGLMLVMATTIFAATLPTKNTNAVDTTSVTDTIQVRVVGDEPTLEITDLTPVQDDSTIYIEQDRTFRFSYYNAESLSLSISYTPFSSITSTSNLSSTINSLTTMGSLIATPSATTVTTTIIDNLPLNYIDGTDDLIISLNSGSYTVSHGDDIITTGDLSNYGYGNYLINLEATNAKGITEKNFEYSYFPLWMDINQSGDTDINLTFKYNSNVVCGAKVYLYRNSDNKEIKVFNLTASDLANSYSIDLVSLGLVDGSYSLKAAAESCDTPTASLGVYFVRQFNYENEVIKIPDTGYFLETIDASSTDILATCLIAFLVVVVVALIITARHNLKAYHHVSAKHSSVKPLGKSLKTTQKTSLKPIKIVKKSAKSLKTKSIKTSKSAKK